MRTVEEIKKLKPHAIELYSQTRTHQQTDLTYINDTFLVPEIEEPHKPLRSGLGRAIIDAAAEQLVTSNPQAFFDTGKTDVDLRLSKTANGWLDLLKRANPHAIKESVKQKGSRGASHIKLCHNERWVVKPIRRDGLPVLFLQPDAMITYTSPQEDDCGWMPNVGVPNWVILTFQMQYKDISNVYPSWKNPLKKDEKATISWLEYWDKDSYYCEADGEAITNGVEKNPYNFTPFVKKYSGFGQGSPDGELSNFIVSDIRFDRDLLKEECILRSNISCINNLFAHKSRTAFSTEEINTEKIRTMHFGAYDMNILDNMPADFKFLEGEEPKPATAEMEQHYRDIKAELTQRHPFLMAGFPLGTSGRQQGMSNVSGLRRYDTIVENTQNEFATAIEMAFAICKKIPTLKPDTLHKGDLDVDIRCRVELKPEDPIEKSARITLGDRMWGKGQGAIDLETLHTQFMGFTLEESKKIKAKIVADNLMLFSPNTKAIYDMIFAEEANLEEYLSQLQQGGGLEQPPTASGEQRTKGEAGTLAGLEQEETNLENRGAREAPVNYTRGM